MYENIKIILCDVDGTLVDDNRVMSNRTKELFEKCRKQGIKFGISSGRPYDDVKRFYKDNWNLDKQFDVIIANNGCEIWNKEDDKLHNLYYLPKETLKEVTLIMKDKFPYANPNLYLNRDLLVGFADERYLGSAKRANRNPVIVDDYRRFYEYDNAKIMFRTPEGKMEEIVDYFASFDHPNYWCYPTQATNFEFIPVGANKGNALKKFCNLYQIDINDIMSFGDNTNDKEMLEYSYGIAVKNATEDCKQVSKIILDKTNNEDGVADYIERNVLK